MDTLVRPIAAQYALSHGILNTSVKDLSDAEAKRRSRNGEGTSIAWTIGHLSNWRVKMLALLGQPRENPFAAQFDGTAATDGSDYPSLAEMMESWNALCVDFASALEKTSGATMDGPMPGSGPHDEKKIMDTIGFFAWHEAYHIGGVGHIRKELGRKAISELVRGQ